jgi:hypothetical protein
VIFISNHLPLENGEITEDSTFFGISTLVLYGGTSLNMVPNTGMFTYPSPSPFVYNGHYQLAYLQAIFPDQSDVSRYRLFICDRDGSNNRLVFPEEGAVGLEPQELFWAPEQTNFQDQLLALIYQGNLWLVNTSTLEATQITGDGLSSRIDWR